MVHRLFAYVKQRFTREIAVRAAFLTALCVIVIDDQGWQGWWIIPTALVVLGLNLLTNDTAFNPTWRSREGKVTVAVVLCAVGGELVYLAAGTPLRWWEPLLIYLGMFASLALVFGGAALLLQWTGLLRWLADTFPYFLGDLMLAGFVLGVLSAVFPSIPSVEEWHVGVAFLLYLSYGAARAIWRMRR